MKPPWKPPWKRRAGGLDPAKWSDLALPYRCACGLARCVNRTDPYVCPYCGTARTIYDPKRAA